MQLGKSIVGAIIGGVLGLGLLVLIHSLTGWDKYWLAIPVAILTGLGVRWMVSTKGHPSYARGALTATVAMAAFFAWYPLMAQLSSRRSLAQPVVAQRETDTDEEPADDDAAAGDATVEPVRMEERPAIADSGMRNRRSQEISAIDIISLCVAAFIAYELGRGSGATHPTTARRTDDDLPPPAVGQTPIPPD